MDAEVLLIILPEAKEFIDYGFLLASTCGFRNVAWILDHAVYVEICTKAIAQGKR